MQEIPLKDWSDVQQKFESSLLHGDWLFRGEHDYDWTFQTTLERHTPKTLTGAEAESTLYKEFKRRAHIYLDSRHIPDKQESGEWLALMQHFGAPTRLLDVTRSPYVALYFAVEDVSEVKSSVVWALRRTWFLETAGAAVLRTSPDPDEARKSAAERFPFVKNTELALGLDNSVLKGDEWMNIAQSIIVPFVPDRLSQRLSIQQGEFLVPRNLNLSFGENLEAMGDSGANILRFTIAHGERPRILERLRLLNLTREQLFPGIDGFAQSFRQFLFVESEEEKLTRLQRSAVLEAVAGERIRLGASNVGFVFGPPPAMIAELEKQKKDHE